MLGKSGANPNNFYPKSKTEFICPFTALTKDIQALRNLPEHMQQAIKREDVDELKALWTTAQQFCSHPAAVFRKILTDSGSWCSKALHYATEPSLIRLLAEYGADLDMRNDEGRTALHEAVLNPNPEKAYLLLKLGADVDARDQKGRGPLHYSVDYSDTIFCRLLLDMGANINLQSDLGWTAMHRAVYLQNAPAVKLMLEERGVRATTNTIHLLKDSTRHIDLGREDQMGRTVMYFAEVTKNTEIAELLERFGAERNSTSGAGFTPNEALHRQDEMIAWEFMRRLEAFDDAIRKYQD
jgi:ankyrin repeat protein